jgi:uncharacterized protein (TIGR03083 family)
MPRDELPGVEPILTAHLFAPLHAELMTLLRTLDDDDWLRPTAAGQWRVRDVAAHLLDGDIRQISFRRDRLPPVPPKRPINDYADLVGFIDELNAVWVDACARVSPALMVELHAHTGPEAARVFEQQDPFGRGLFGVAWAGEAESVNWFDTAREYTERWHHQQQIRDAVGAEPLVAPQWLHPVIDTFLRALPHAYRDTPAADGTQIVFDIAGDAGGQWTLRGTSDPTSHAASAPPSTGASAIWSLFAGAAMSPDALITIDDDTTWRLLTKGLARADAAGRVRIDGEPILADPFLRMLAIMG